MHAALLLEHSALCTYFSIYVSVARVTVVAPACVTRLHYISSTALCARGLIAA
jgi:hypothetical protein